jgi:hypothetical protein
LVEMVVIGEKADNSSQQIKAVTSLATKLHNVIMKLLSTAGAVSTGLRSGTNQTPNGQQNVTGGSPVGGRSSSFVLGWPTQTGRSPLRSHDTSAYMMSQLG